MKTKEHRIMLSVGTATRRCSLAVLRGANEVCALWQGDHDFSASDKLLLEIQQILEKAEIKLSEINLLAATIGPGSFTGLRIGLAIVKGLAAASQIPIIGIPTLEALAFEEIQTKSAVCSILPAGRQEFFAQIFRVGENLITHDLQTGELEQLLNKLKSESDLRLVAPVETHEKISEFIISEKIGNWTVDPPPDNIAVCAGKIAFKLFQENKWSNRSSHLIYGRDAIVLRKKDE